jgi:hypothetical protein
MTKLSNNFFAIPMPNIATDPWIINNGKESVGLNWYEPDKIFGGEDMTFSGGVKLPPGQYTFIATSDDITKEQAHEIMDKIIKPNEPVYYKLYDDESDSIATTDWQKAWKSLLNSLNLTSRVAIIKKITP